MPTIPVKVELFEIPLLKELGFFYAKVIHYRVKESDKIEMIVRIFDSYHTDLIKKSIEWDLFETNNYFTYPFILMNQPRKRGKYRWYLINKIITPNESDFIVPDFVTISIKQKEEAELNELKIISLIKNLVSKREMVEYKYVKHLSQYEYYSDYYIQAYITFLWLKRNDKKISDFFPEIFSNLNKQILNNNITEKEFNSILALKIVLSSIERNPDYQDIPLNIRDKKI